MFQFRKRAQDFAPGEPRIALEEDPRAAVEEPEEPAAVLPEAGPRGEDLAQNGTPAPLLDGSEDPSPQSGAEDLLGEHSRRMNLVGGGALAASIEEAVRLSLKRHLPDVPADIGRDVARTARGALLVLLKSRSKKVRGLPKAHFLQEVEASRRKIVAQREAARRELEALLEELGSKRAQFRQREETLVRETFDKGVLQDQELSEIIYQALGGANATPEMREVQRRVTGLVLESLQRERQKAVEDKTSAHDEELRRYELRIAKLTKSLELTEEELKRIAAMKNIDSGVASIYRTVQGLGADDDHAEAKKEMLAGIFQANLALQRQATSAAG